jgi:hypothetical protein
VCQQIAEDRPPPETGDCNVQVVITVVMGATGTNFSTKDLPYARTWRQRDCDCEGSLEGGLDRLPGTVLVLTGGCGRDDTQVAQREPDIDKA